jgi:hypothetical protein
MPSAGRLAAELRELRWSHVLVELLLLIVGILIALAVDGWMDDRRDARLERTYLERLERDLAQSMDTLDGFVTFERQQTADGVLAYRGLRGVAEIEREPVAVALGHLAHRRTLRLQGATYQDLVSTGNLRLIRNPELRDAVVRLYEDADRTTTIVDRNNQVLVDQGYGLPLLDSGLVAPRFSTNIPAIAGQLQSLQASIGLPPDPTADRLWQLPADAPERTGLANRVLRRTIVSTTTLSQVETLQGQFRVVREALAAELARRWPVARAAESGPRL